MREAIRRWLMGFASVRRGVADLNERVANLESSVTLAESWMTELRIARKGTSHGQK